MSSPLLIVALMACAAFAAGTAAGWSIAWLAVPFAECVRSTARARSMLMAQLRMLPLATAVVLAASQVHAFVRFEQSRVESAGPLLIALAAVGLLLMADALWQTMHAWRSTRATVIAMRRDARHVALPGWAGSAWLMRTPAPAVFVAGFFSPQLFIAWRVLRHCTRQELAAIIAHEAAHVRAHDNLVQYLFRMTPGARFVPRLAAALEREWRASTEEAADQSAGDRAGYLELASALTKVARLVSASAPLAASALIGESNLDTRVRRLIAGGAKAPPSMKTKAPPSVETSLESVSEGATSVAPPAAPVVAPSASRAVWLPFLLVLVTGVALQIPTVGVALHEMFELLVRSY